jgi:hypothetical protein
MTRILALTKLATLKKDVFSPMLVLSIVTIKTCAPLMVALLTRKNAFILLYLAMTKILALSMLAVLTLDANMFLSLPFNLMITMLAQETSVPPKMEFNTSQSNVILQINAALENAIPWKDASTATKFVMTMINALTTNVPTDNAYSLLLFVQNKLAKQVNATNSLENAITRILIVTTKMHVPSIAAMLTPANALMLLKSAQMETNAPKTPAMQTKDAYLLQLFVMITILAPQILATTISVALSSQRRLMTTMLAPKITATLQPDPSITIQSLAMITILAPQILAMLRKDVSTNK